MVAAAAARAMLAQEAASRWGVAWEECEVEAGFGPIDVLVNSAGAALRTSAESLTPAAWRAAMDAKFFTYVNVVDPVIKRMAERRSGSVLNIVGMGLPSFAYIDPTYYDPPLFNHANSASRRYGVCAYGYPKSGRAWTSVSISTLRVVTCAGDWNLAPALYFER